MARYEGMEELLERVRSRLEVEDETGAEFDASVALVPNVHDQYYAEVVRELLVVMNNSEQLRSRMQPARLEGLSEEQRNHIRKILGKTLRELLACRSKLEET